ncbi:MAG TPA: hypothetical protein DEQ61_00960, partial [Streptomyces sp.]|nr:hypothetical protein [Streptomyces sp.]
SAAVYRARPPRAMSPALAVLHRLRWLMRMPGARLTGLGCGVLALLLALAAGAADHLLPSGLPTVYGGVFLFAATVCALWVRPVELLAAPVAMPITFLLGLAPVTGGTDLTDRLLSLLSSLSLNADWLYAGTLLACTIVAVRKLLLMAERAALRAAGLQDPAGRRPAAPDPEDRLG